MSNDAMHQWTERTLSSGFKLCVDGEGTLRVSDTEGWMFAMPLRDVRQVSWGSRSPGIGGRFSSATFPLNVALFHGPTAFLSFVCAEADLKDLRFVFDGRPLVDMAEQMRRLADGL